MNIANQLKIARGFRRLSQSELAKMAGLEPSMISHFECGRRSPSLKNLRKLTEALRISADFLIGLDDDIGRAATKFQYAYLISIVSTVEDRLEYTEKLLLELAGEALIKHGLGEPTRKTVAKLAEKIIVNQQYN